MNQAKNLTLDLLKRQSQQHLKQIEAINQEQKAIVASHPPLNVRLDIRVSILGLAATTALVLLISMPELGSMDAKHAASLAGLALITR